MARDEKGFRIGFFGDVRREEAGATLFERVVETGSLVLRQVGGNRAGEMAVHRFLSSPHVTPEEILATAAEAKKKVLTTQPVSSRKADVNAMLLLTGLSNT